MSLLVKPKLLILDEMGYLTLDSVRRHLPVPIGQ